MSSPPQDGAARIARASLRAEGLAAFAESAGRLGRLLKQARQESDPARAATLASELEGRMRLAEEDLRDLAGVPPSAPGASGAQPLQEEALRGMIRELAEALSRRTEPASPEDSLQPLRDRLDRLEAAAGDGNQRLIESLKVEHRQASLDLETLERQIASLEAGMGALQDRLQQVEAGLASIMMATASSAPPPDAAHFLGQVKDLVQQAVSESFSFPDLGALVDQKVGQRAESMRVEIRELEAALVKAIMQQLETKPVGEAQVEALVDQRVNQLLLKYVQR